MTTFTIIINNDWTNERKVFVTTATLDSIGSKSEAIADSLTEKTGDRHWVLECLESEVI